MIGETLYIYNEWRSSNRWQPVQVVGETRTSWVLLHNYKIAKDTLLFRGEPPGSASRQVYTEATKADQEWARTNRNRILNAVQGCDVQTLRRIDALLSDG